MSIFDHANLAIGEFKQATERDHLTAAAPTMLAALKEVERTVFNPTLLRQVRLAIREAEGRL
jgi:hypothetical protein